MRDAAQVAAMLESMRDDRTTANVKGLRDDDSASITADTLEAVRFDANTGKGSATTQSIPETSGPGPKQSAKAGPLARLLSKVSPDPMEILQALDDLSDMIAGRVVRKIRAFHRESEAQHHVRDAKREARKAAWDAEFKTHKAAWDAESKARTESQDAKLEAQGAAQDARIDSLDKQMLLLLVLAMIQSFLLGMLATLSLMYWFSR